MTTKETIDKLYIELDHLTTLNDKPANLSNIAVLICQTNAVLVAILKILTDIQAAQENTT